MTIPKGVVTSIIRPVPTVLGVVVTSAFILSDAHDAFPSSLEYGLAAKESMLVLAPLALAFSAMHGASSQRGTFATVLRSSPVGNGRLNVVSIAMCSASACLVYIVALGLTGLYALFAGVYFNGLPLGALAPVAALPTFCTLGYLAGRRLPYRVTPFVLAAGGYVLLVAPLYAEGPWTRLWFIKQNSVSPWTRESAGNTALQLLVFALLSLTAVLLVRWHDRLFIWPTVLLLLASAGTAGGAFAANQDGRTLNRPRFDAAAV
ncbi:MAG: hypothetical protein L0H74_13595 [Brachybacterium sp.]|nr:hypothetical protein [Brachybacterium sp.]